MKIIEKQAILIVEDNDDDFESAHNALNQADNFLNPIYRCEDGQEALDFLYNKGKFEDTTLFPEPSLILLDLNMPGIDGRSVLKKIKSDDRLQKIPVIVFTTSSSERDIQACYAMGANSYIQKPVSLDSLVLSLQRLKEYWFRISILPKDPNE